MTGTEMETYISRILMDENKVFYTQSEIYKGINFALYVLATLFHAFFKSHSFSGTYPLDIPSDFLCPYSLYCDNTRLYPMSLSELRNLGLSTTGTPQYYAFTSSHILLWPKPTSSHDYILNYAYIPDEIADGSDPPLDDPWHYPMAHIAVGRCLMVDLKEHMLARSGYWLRRGVEEASYLALGIDRDSDFHYPRFSLSALGGGK